MSVEEISHRYESYLIEMSWAKECDFVVESVEGHIEKLIADVKEIIEKNA
jgi:hypothetical protein